MDLYQVALYAHFLAIVGTVAATTILHVNVRGMRSARTVAEARLAAGVVQRVAPFMPLFALALLATGGYLVYLRWSMRYGFITAGIAGLIALVLTSLVAHKPRLAKLGTALKDAKDGPVDDTLRAKLEDPVVLAAMRSNHTIALAIMFVMTTKPSLGGSFAVLAIAPVVGLLSWLNTNRQSSIANRLAMGD